MNLQCSCIANQNIPMSASVYFQKYPSNPVTTGGLRGIKQKRQFLSLLRTPLIPTFNYCSRWGTDAINEKLKNCQHQCYNPEATSSIL